MSGAIVKNLSKEEKQEAELIIHDLLGLVIPLTNLVPMPFLPTNKQTTKNILNVMKAKLRERDSEINALEEIINEIYENKNTQSGGNGNGNVKQISLSILLTFALLVGLVAYLANEELIRFTLTEKVYKQLYGDQGKLCNAQEMRRAMYVHTKKIECASLQTLEQAKIENVERIITTFLGIASAAGATTFAKAVRSIKEGNGGEFIVNIYQYFKEKIKKDNVSTSSGNIEGLPNGIRNGELPVGHGNNGNSNQSGPPGQPIPYRHEDNGNNNINYGGKKKRKMRKTKKGKMRKTKKGRLCKNKKRTTYHKRSRSRRR